MIVGAIGVDLPATVPKYISSFFELIYYRSLHAISNYDDIRLSHLISRLHNSLEASSFSFIYYCTIV